MKTRTYAAAFLACMLAACSGDDTANPVAPSAPAAAPETAAADPNGAPLPAAAPAVAEPLPAPAGEIPPPLRFDLPQLPRGWFARPAFPAAGHQQRTYTGLRIVSDDDEYPGRIDQHGTEKLRAVITRNDGVSATSGADWRTGNTHVATVNQHGHVTAHNPGRFDTIATTRGLEARMTGMEVHPGPGRAYNDRFWQELVYNAYDAPGGRKSYIYTLDDPLPGFYLWLGDPAGRRVADESWIGWARRNFPRAVEALTGERYYGRIEGGLVDRNETGWITVVFDTPPHENDSNGSCGRARVGANPGRIWLYLDSRGRPMEGRTGSCRYGNYQIHTIMHEIGHAMGFRHVEDGRAIMFPGAVYSESGRYPTVFTAREQYHAQLAYRVGRGWRDYCGWPLRVACGELPRRGAAPRMLIEP